MSISETCSCGASITVEAQGQAVLLQKRVEEWRENHRHEPRRDYITYPIPTPTYPGGPYQPTWTSSGSADA